MNFGWWYVGGWWVPLCFAIIASKWYIDSEEKMLYSSVVPPFHQHSRDYCRHWEGSRFEPGVGGGKLCMFASERYERSAVVGGLFITSAHCLGSLNFTCVLHHSICFCNIYIYCVDVDMQNAPDWCFLNWLKIYIWTSFGNQNWQRKGAAFNIGK